ncbi:hypothetical protein ACP4OV_010060 [Aristida adscensionis]
MRIRLLPAKERKRRPRMAPRRLARLCDLVGASLLPHLVSNSAAPALLSGDPAAALSPPPSNPPLAPPPSPQEQHGSPRQLAREDERRLLLALSRVNKAIREWDKQEEGEPSVCVSEEETVSCSSKAHSCCLPPEQHLNDGFGCLANVVSILVGFLGFCSDYVRHSAGNILVAISCTLIKFESAWIQFIESVWVAIHTASTCDYNASPSQIDSNIGDITISSTNIMSFIAILNLRCFNINGKVVASLFRVLHAILKFLKHSDDEMKDDFICLSIHHIQKMHWDSVHELDAGKLVSHVKDGRFSFSNDFAKSGILMGSLLQLLCSLLEQSCLEGTDAVDLCVKLVVIIPKLAVFVQEQHEGPKSFHHYAKHKILMVMMRLKPYMQHNCSHIVCWLKLIRQYFPDLLHKPILQHIAKPDNILEGSPFLLNMVGFVKSQDKSTRHLQRQAIYLFLSCSIWLSCDGNDGKLKCSCKRDDCLLGHKVYGCSNHCNCIGLSEISDWFQRCYLDMSFESKSSTDFAFSFLQLYVEEDDMLFSILLELLDAPRISLNLDSMYATELIGAKLFLSIFDPIHLFHLLLLLLHYDHLVLIDYLISKDVGVSCAQYLLRCLRLVSQSWHAFVDDSVYETKIEKLNSKRQRTSKDINCASGSSNKEHRIGSSCDSAVEDLQKKGLFPYNPKPLLRSQATPGASMAAWRYARSSCGVKQMWSYLCAVFFMNKGVLSNKGKQGRDVHYRQPRPTKATRCATTSSISGNNSPSRCCLAYFPSHGGGGAPCGRCLTRAPHWNQVLRPGLPAPLSPGLLLQELA